MSAIVRRFQVSTTSVFILEIGDPNTSSGASPYVRFFTNGQQVEVSGVPYELSSPYAAADLLSLQFCQVNDVMYIVHADYPVYKLSRIADTSWTLAAVVFDEPAMLDANLTDTTITPSATTGTGITLAASDDIFFDGHVGSYWKIGHKRAANTLSHTIDADESSSTIAVFGDYTLRSYGTWTATLTFEKSTDSGSTWSAIHKVVGVSDQNLEIKGTSDVECLLRVTVSGFSSATDARATIETQDATIYGIVKVTAVGSGSSATADVVESLYATTATTIWNEGAWSTYRGFPRAVTLHEQRLVLGGTDNDPSTIWGSAVDDFENFASGTDDDVSYRFTLAGLELNAVQWLASLKALLVGTTGSEWRVIGDELGAVISPTKVSAKQFSYFGSEYVQAENTGTAVMFVERKGRRVREIAPEGDSFTTQDLSLLTEHLTRDGYVVQMNWQRDARILWCVTSDGRALALTYNREQSVLGWARMVTDGDFHSVAAIYGDQDAEDEVWFIVERTVLSSQVFYVERIDPTIWEDREDYFGVDSGLSYSGSPVGEFSGLDHLAGRTVDALVDGVAYRGLTVTGAGHVVLPTGVTGSVVHIGLPFESILSPFRLDADSQLGVHAGKSKRIDKVDLRVYRSAGITYDFGGATARAIKAKDGQVTTGLFGDPEAEDQPLTLETGNTTDPRLNIRQTDPLPLTVVAMRVGYNVSGD